MAEYTVAFDADSNVLRVVLYHATTFIPLTGLAFNTSGLVVGTITNNEAATTAYTEAGGTIETVAAIGTYAAPTPTKCRFVEVDATNHPGLYEVHLADARYAIASAKRLFVSFSGAANLMAKTIDVDLVRYNPQDVVRLGLTALPNAAADAAGGLPISDAGGLDLDTQIGTDIDAILVDTGTTLDAALAVVDGNVDSILTDTGTTLDALINNINNLVDMDVILRTTIATLASQVSFTLTDGSTDNDVYNGCIIVVKDASTAVQRAIGTIADYTGATKTVALFKDPGVFTMATTDIVAILAPR
jgi:hypothetical protein